MRAEITITLNIENEEDLPVIQTEIENALYGRVDYEACNADIYPEDGEEDGEEDW